MQQTFYLKNWKAHAAVLSANLIFGINFSAVQFITKKFIAPFGLNVIRVGVSTLLLWALIFIPDTRAGIQKKDLGRFFLCAITGVVINQMLFIKGLSMTLSIHASLLILVTPIFITIVASWIGTEKFTFLKIAGLITGVSGAVILVLNKEQAAAGGSILWGDLFIIINAISYAFYFVLVKPLMKEYNPVHVIRWVFTLSLLFVIPIGFHEFSEINWSLFSWKEMLATGFIVIGATFLAYLFNLYGIHKLGAGVTGSYIYTQPFFASLIAVLILHETFTYEKIIAAALIVSGVYLVSRKSKEI